MCLPLPSPFFFFLIHWQFVMIPPDAPPRLYYMQHNPPSHTNLFSLALFSVSVCNWNPWIYTNLIELIESLSNSDRYKFRPGTHKRQRYWNTTLVCALSFFCLQLTRAAIRHELPDRHITANKTRTKHPLLMHERLFDPGETFIGMVVITVPQTTQ